MYTLFIFNKKGNLKSISYFKIKFKKNLKKFMHLIGQFSIIPK